MGNVKLGLELKGGLGFWSSGLSRRGPSHNSVLMLSSEIILLIAFLSGGVVERGDIVGFVDDVPRPPPRSSWKIGILKLQKCSFPLSSTHLGGIEGFFEKVNVDLVNVVVGEGGVGSERRPRLW
jgi:hypothetical protein